MNQLDRQGLPPLSWAAQHTARDFQTDPNQNVASKGSLIQLLVEHGADVKIR